MFNWNLFDNIGIFRNRKEFPGSVVLYFLEDYSCYLLFFDSKQASRNGNSKFKNSKEVEILKKE